MIKYGIINKSGSWYEYDGNKIGQGRDNAKKTLLNDLDMYAAITQLVKEKLYNKE